MLIRAALYYEFTVLQPSHEDYLHWKRGSASFQYFCQPLHSGSRASQAWRNISHLPGVQTDNGLNEQSLTMRFSVVTRLKGCRRKAQRERERAEAEAEAGAGAGAGALARGKEGGREENEASM